MKAVWSSLVVAAVVLATFWLLAMVWPGAPKLAVGEGG